MTLKIIKEPPADRSKYVTTTKGASGHYAVILWWAPENGGFWEPWQTGDGRYASLPQAAAEAKDIAELHDIGYLPPAAAII